MVKRSRKYIIYSIVLLLVVGLSVGFSAFQKQLLIDDSIFDVRIHEDVRLSNMVVSHASNAVSNTEDFNVKKLYGNITFDSASSYVLYKIDLTNYGNVKSGLLKIDNNTSGVNYSICDSTGSNCTTDVQTPVCSGSNCTLGTTKEIYLKVGTTSAGTKSIDLDFDFEPYNTITYTNFSENINSFKTEILSHDTYQVTFTSKPEKVDVSGTVTYTYNKNTGVLDITDVESNINIQAKYLATDVVETTYTGTDPDNYVLLGDELFRIITKGSIDDGYGNTENRVKIIKDSSIGQYAYNSNGDSYVFGDSTIKDILNITYYNSLSQTEQELIDTAKYTYSIFSRDPVATRNFTSYFALINKSDYTINSSWLNNDQFTIDVFDEHDYAMEAVVNGNDGAKNVSVLMNTYPVTYLRSDVLIVGGSGTRTNPYQLELKGDGLMPNPTKIVGKTLTFNNTNQEIIEVTNKVGTPYYSTSQLNSSNYTSGTTTIPRRTAAGSYTYYYYIPAGSGYKAKSGSVIARINGLTFAINYQKGDNISSIGKESDTCTTTGTNTSCNVTLPTITPSAGWENGMWYNGSNSYNPNASFTLNSSNSGVTLTSQVSGKTFVATIKYYDGTGVGSKTESCTVSSGNDCSVIIPGAVSSSRGVYNSTYKGLASAINTMTSSSTLRLTDSGTFYAVYSSPVTNYYYNSSYTSRTLYRNEYFNSENTLVSRLATSNDSTQNSGTANGPGNSAWTGFSTSQDTTMEYNSIEAAASSTAATLYSVYTFSINYQKGLNVAEIGSVGDVCRITTADTECNVTLPTITPTAGHTSIGWHTASGLTTGMPEGSTYPIDTNGTTLYANATGATYTATFYYYNGSNIATTTNSCTVDTGSTCNVSIPSAVSNSTGKYGSTYKGVATTASSMDTGTLTLNSNTSKFYAIYSEEVTRYYYSSGYKTNTIYRNEYFLSDTQMVSVLSTVDNGTTNYTSSRGPGSSNFVGLSTAQDTTPEYTTVQDAANSTSKTLYTVYEFVINYEKSVNVSEIGATSATCRVTTSDTTCNVILPTITPNTGYVSVGWSETNGATTGSAPLTIYTINTNNRTLYANATAGNYINTTTNESYNTLNEAFTNVQNNQTIKVLQDTTETNTVKLVSGKTGIKLDLNGKTITMGTYSFINNGTLEIKNSTNNESRIVSSSIISNSGSLTIDSLKIEGGTYCAIENGSSATLIINGSSTVIKSASNLSVINSGTMIMNNGSIIDNGALNSGTLTMSGGTISGAIGLTNRGTATIIGGTITGTNHGLYLNGGTITLGSNDSTVSTNNPLVQGTGTSNSFGVNLNSGTLNFYDGIVKSSSGTGKAINGTVTSTPSNYFVYKETVNGVESAYLLQNYINTTTGVSYATLGEAFTAVESNQTIKVLNNTTETSNAGLLVEQTGIKLDLNGKTISSSGRIFNRGELDIYNSSNTPGSFITSDSSALYNTGTLTLNQTNNTNTTIISSTSTNSHAEVILSYSNVTIYSNSQVTGEYGFTIFGLSNSNVTINGGLLSNTNGTVIEAAGTTIMNDGSIIGIIGVNLDSGTDGTGYKYGSFTMTGGTITASSIGIDFYRSENTVTIGTNDSNVSTTSPVIQTTGTTDSYGIKNNVGGTINFYDGIIKSSSGTGYAIDGEVSNPARGYNVHTETTNGVESAYLVEGAVLMASSSGGGTNNYLRTTIKRQDIESLTFSNSLANHTANGTDCFDVSRDEDGTVLAWVTDSDSNGKYEMTIGANGTMYASSGAYLFSSLENLNSLNGMNNISTSLVTTMYYMFYRTGYNSTTFTLDLGNKFDTSNVVNMECMFNSTGYSSPVFTLNLRDKFDTSKVTTMNNMFSYSGRNSSVYTLDLEDKFDTSKVISMNYMFREVARNGSNFTLDLGDKFDTSKVTSMSFMFYLAGYSSTVFTLDLGDKFDTSGVTNMNYMFYYTGYSSTVFTLDLGDKFDTSKVTNMSYMFNSTGYSSTVFTLDLGDEFDTSKVTNMSYMFYSTGYRSTALVLDLGDKFDTSKVTSMEYMFYSTGYSSPVFTLDLGDKFDTSSVTNMGYMFYQAGYSSPVFTLDLGNKFDTSNVNTMRSMFSDIGHSNTDFTIYLGNKFDTSKVTTMREMFYNSPVKTIYVSSNYDTSRTANSTNMFDGCTSLVGGAGTSYSASNPKDKTYAHIDEGPSNPGYFTRLGGTLAQGNNDINKFFNNSPMNKNNVSSITFQPYLGAPTGSLGSWDASLNLDNSVIAYYTDNNNDGYYEVTVASNGKIYAPQDSSFLFASFIFIPEINGIEYLDTSNVVSMEGMFHYTFNATSLDVSHFDTSNVTNMAGMFADCRELIQLDVSHFNTSNVTNMASMFSNCFKVLALNVSNWDTSNVTNMGGLFYDCAAITSLDLNYSNFDTSNVTDMGGMFYGCAKLTSLNLNISNFNTSNVTNMSSMFELCDGLTILDLSGSNFDTSNVTDMSDMFARCDNLVTINLDGENFGTSSVTDMNRMFYGGIKLKNIYFNKSNFTTLYVTNMNSMFSGCSSLTYLDLSLFKTSRVTNMGSMFAGCTNLVTIRVDANFTTSAVTNSSSMFYGCTSLIGGNGTVFNSNYTDKTYARVDGGTVYPGYFTGSGGVLGGYKTDFATYGSIETITFQPYLKAPNNYTESLDVSFDQDNSVICYYSDVDNDGTYELNIQSAGYIIAPQDSSVLFWDLPSLTAINGLEYLDTSNVTAMAGMFGGTYSLHSLDVSHFDTSNVENMSSMFWNTGLDNLDVSHFDTSRVVYFNAMFQGLYNVPSLDVRNFDTSHANTMNNMFSGCSSLTELDLSNFDTRGVSNMDYMFDNLENVITIYVGNNFVTGNVTGSNYLFGGCTSLVGGAGTTFDSNHIDITYAHVDGGTSNPGYFTYKNSTASSGVMSIGDVGSQVLNSGHLINNLVNKALGN